MKFYESLRGFYLLGGTGVIELFQENTFGFTLSLKKKVVSEWDHFYKVDLYQGYKSTIVFLTVLSHRVKYGKMLL